MRLPATGAAVMRARRTYRRVGMFTAVAVTAFLCLGLTDSAHAAVRLPHIDDSAAESILRDLEAVHVPPPLLKSAGATAAETYGSGNVGAELLLGSATKGEADAVAAERFASSEADERGVRQCASTAFKGTAGNYRKALNTAVASEEPPEWPNFQQDFTSGVSACLKDAFPEARDQVVGPIANYLGEQAAGYATEALHADSAAGVFSRWMDVTADRIAPAQPILTRTTTTRTTPPATSSDSSSFPWWVLIFPVGIVGWLLVRRGRKQ
jgi:hypothetical protein